MSVLKLNLEDYGVDVKDVGRDPSGHMRKKAGEHLLQVLTKSVQ